MQRWVQQLVFHKWHQIKNCLIISRSSLNGKVKIFFLISEIIIALIIKKTILGKNISF
jgi:hypothetical protein